MCVVGFAALDLSAWSVDTGYGRSPYEGDDCRSAWGGSGSRSTERCRLLSAGREVRRGEDQSREKEDGRAVSLPGDGDQEEHRRQSALLGQSRGRVPDRVRKGRDEGWVF